MAINRKDLLERINKELEELGQEGGFVNLERACLAVRRARARANLARGKKHTWQAMYTREERNFINKAKPVTCEEQVKAKFEQFCSVADVIERGYTTAVIICNDYRHVESVLDRYRNLEDVIVSKCNQTAKFDGMTIKVMSADRLEAALGYDRNTTALLDWRRAR